MLSYPHLVVGRNINDYAVSRLWQFHQAFLESLGLVLCPMTLNIVWREECKLAYGENPKKPVLVSKYYPTTQDHFDGKNYYTDLYVIELTKEKKKVFATMKNIEEALQKHLIFKNGDGYADDYPAFGKYKKSPRIWGKPNADDEVFGHEFEMRFPNYTKKIVFAEWIKKNYAPMICENDGSLDGPKEMEGPSLELITPPMNFADSVNKLTKVLGHAKTLGAKGHDAGNNYAWHVTVNLDESLSSRFQYFMNRSQHRLFWKLISRRDGGYNPGTEKDYCKFIEFTHPDYYGYEFWEQKWLQKPADHYYAIYPRKNGGIEIRFLRSTLNMETVSATLDILGAARDFIVGGAALSNAKFMTSYLSTWPDFLLSKISPASSRFLSKIGADRQLETYQD